MSISVSLDVMSRKQFIPITMTTEILTVMDFADKVIKADHLDISLAFNFIDLLYSNIETLAVGDKDRILTASKEVIDWLNEQPPSRIPREDWFSMVKKLCTSPKDQSNDDLVDTPPYSHLAQVQKAAHMGATRGLKEEIHRTNAKNIVKSDVFLRLVEMCFSEKGTEEEVFGRHPSQEPVAATFKDFYGKVSLLGSFLDCGWADLNDDQVKYLRNVAANILEQIPPISADETSEKIFIQTVLRCVHRIIHLVAEYDGSLVFSMSMLDLYRKVIEETEQQYRDQEQVVTSLVMNLSALDSSECSRETMELLWQMLLKMSKRWQTCSRTAEEVDREERRNISPHYDFHKSLDMWLSKFIHAAIQDSLEEKTYRREEVCNWILKTLSTAACRVHTNFVDVMMVCRACLDCTSDEDGPALCLSFSRLYTKLMKDNTYSLQQQNDLVDVILGVSMRDRNHELTACKMLKRIYDGDSTNSVMMNTVHKVIDHEYYREHSQQSDHIQFSTYLVLEDCIASIDEDVKPQLAEKIVAKINAMESRVSGECVFKNWEILRHKVRNLNVVLGLMIEEKPGDTKAYWPKCKIEEDGTSKLSHFNRLFNSPEYTKMLGVSVQAYLGFPMRSRMGERICIPPANAEFLKKIVSQEDLKPYHHLYYFHLHESLLKKGSSCTMRELTEYWYFLLAINGNAEMEDLLNEIASHKTVDRITKSMLVAMSKFNVMTKLPSSTRYISVLTYIKLLLEFNNPPVLCPDTMEALTEAITSVEVRYVLNEFSKKTSSEDKEVSIPRIRALIGASKVAFLTPDERTRLMGAVKTNVERAVFSLLAAYNDQLGHGDSLNIQFKLVAILKHHDERQELLMPNLRLRESTEAFLYMYFHGVTGPPVPAIAHHELIKILLTALVQSPSVKYSMEKGDNGALSPYIVTPLIDRFTRHLLFMLSSSETKTLPILSWKKNTPASPAAPTISNIFYPNTEPLYQLLSEFCFNHSPSLPLIVLLSKTIHEKDARPDSMVTKFMREKGPEFVVHVLQDCECKPVYFHALIPIVEWLREKADISEAVDNMLVECVPRLFSNPIEELLEFFPVNIQSTDRYAQTNLYWRSKMYHWSDDSGEGNQEEADPVLASFKILAQLSTFKRLIFAMMETLVEKLPLWLENVDEDVLVLRGVTVTPNTRVIWKTQLISQSFAYISNVAEEVRKKELGDERVEENSDEEDNDDKIILERRDEEEATVCTFVNTSQEFTKQHWYNCYTCNMTDNEGVCTVCALNCHRGHDISYSKQGPFFCDCGAKKCNALKGAERKPPLKRMKRMKKSMKDEKWTFHAEVPSDLKKEEIEKYLKAIQEVIAKNSKSVNDILMGIEVAYEGKFTIATRREAALKSMEAPTFKYNEMIMVGKQISNEGLDDLERLSDFMSAKEFSDMIRLRDGTTLFFHVNEHTNHLSLVYMGVPRRGGGELGETRIEREPLSFNPKRIEVMNEHIAISGIDQVVYLKASLESGDVTQKGMIRIKEASNTNPILKCIWSMESDEKETLTLAVATNQFVRIYNVYKDMDNYEVELVLPVGNVIDIAFVKKVDADYKWITVLSSPNVLYYHQLGGPGPNILDDSRSIYLTNTLPMPTETNPVSLYFSQVTRMLYLSFATQLYCVHIKNGDVTELTEEKYNKVEAEGGYSWIGWKESDGLVAAICHHNPANKVLFIYPTLNEVLVQVASIPSDAHSMALAPTTSFDSVMAVVILNSGNQRYRKPAMLFKGNWLSQPDLWIEHRPMKMDKIAMVEEMDDEECTDDHLLTMFENYSEVKEVEYSSKELEDFYSSEDLTERLKIPNMKSIVSMNRPEVFITVRVSKRQFEVKGLQLEVDERYSPRKLSYNGREMDLDRRVHSVYDLHLLPTQTITSERPLVIKLTCREGRKTAIMSLRAFGDSREDLYARCLTWPSLSLPYQCVFHSLRMMRELLEYNQPLPTRLNYADEGEKKEWIAEFCRLVITPRACRPAVTAMASSLLKRYHKGDEMRYHEAKDEAVVQSFAEFARYSTVIPSPVLRSYIYAFSRIMEQRYDNLIKYSEKFFGDVISMGGVLHGEMSKTEGGDNTLSLLISLYVHFACSLLANNHASSGPMMAQMIGVIINHKRSRVWRILKEELGRVIRDSLDGVGLQSGDWIDKLIGVMTDTIVNEMRLPIPVWWKEGVEVEVEKIDRTFQRSLDGMNALLEVTSHVIRELEAEKRVTILAELVDRVDTISVMREEDDVRVKNVRMSGVIALIGLVCKSTEKEKTEVETDDLSIPDTASDDWDRTIDGDDEEETLHEYSGREEEDDPEMLKIVSDIVQPLLADAARRDKLLSMNFNLMEESLKYLSTIKEGEPVESEWILHGDMGRVSTTICLLEYYLRVGKWTLIFPTLYLLCKPPLASLSEERKKIICEFVMVDERITLRDKADLLLYQACGYDEKKCADTKNEYMIMRHMDTLRFEYLPKLEYSHEDSTAMIEIINGINQWKSECWRRVCEANLRWILVLTSKVTEQVGIAMLELIQTALKITKEDDFKESRASQPPPSPADFSIADTLFECAQSRNLLKVLMIKYLLGREEARRWLMHSVCRSLMQLAGRKYQTELAKMLFYEVLPIGRRLGERAAQLADLCSAYLPTLLPSSVLQSMAVEELKNLDALLGCLEKSEQKGAADWLVAAGMGWREALYLAPDPCIQCLKPNETMELIKLSSIKAESKYTTNAMMYKLNGHYEISKIWIRISDKKNRTIRKVSVYYVYGAIENAIDLKSNRDMWKPVASSSVLPNDNEVTLTVSIPICTNGLVIELTEVNENRGNSDVHCPRCSSLVRPNPGVCDSCGENVYQCVKCRAINYDEKEPFLCSACGHCKYARLDISVVGRVQPIMIIATDKEKPMASRASKAMNKLQWEMEAIRAQLRTNTLLAQSLTIRNPPVPAVTFPVDGRILSEPTFPHLAAIGANDSRSTALNECMKKIHWNSSALVAQTMQLVSIREAMKKMDHTYTPSIHSSTHAGFNNASDQGCIGCLTSSIIHSLSLLRSFSGHSSIANIIIKRHSLIYERLVSSSASIDILRDELESLMIRLCESDTGADRLSRVVYEGHVSASALARSLITQKNGMWSMRLDTLLEVAKQREDEDEAQIGVLNVLINTLADAKLMIRMLEGRKSAMEFMEEMGPSSSKEKKEKTEVETPWAAVDAIINGSEKKIDVDDIEKEKEKAKETEKFLWRLVFSRSLFVRSLAGKLLLAMLTLPGETGSTVSMFLQGLRHAQMQFDQERVDQFFLAFNCLIERGQVKMRLFQGNFHLHLLSVIHVESTRLVEWEKNDESVCHSSGNFVYHCVNLLHNVLSGSWMESLFLRSVRHTLIVPLLHSSILIRRVTIKRNRPIARALNQIEGLLRRCTSDEGLCLLTSAVACLSNVLDEKSRADVVGVILETLDPTEKQSSDEFLMHLEKDPAQEDFLQGRMQQNPYKSGDASMGPLMRQIKDKICRESELIAFLDDDNGMELLVNGKIISLSLPVKLVYESVWKPYHPGEPMVIIYRMRGLMGDAVEPFVETLDDKNEGESIGDEESRLLAAFLECGGVSTTMKLLSTCSLSPNGCILLVQLRKLLVHLLKVEKMRRELINQRAVSVLLGVVKRARIHGKNTEQSMDAAEIDLLKMTSALVTDPKHHPILTGMSAAECEWLFRVLEEEELSTERRDRSLNEMIVQVAKILGNGVLGSNKSEELLVNKLMKGLNWNELMNQKSEDRDLPVYDEDRDDFNRLVCAHIRRQKWIHDERRADSFILVIDGIVATDKGQSLKHRLIDAGVIEEAVKGLLLGHPPLYGTVESPEWKTYLARPALKLILGLLKGMAKGDERSQVEIAKKALPMLHRLEQVSSAEHLGTLAENVMEALSQNKEVAKQIDGVRDETKQKKRQMAMAMREKQLNRLGMKMGRKGEVKVSSRAIVNEPDLGEASDPLTSCCICRESILTGTRVPATYAYAIPYRSENISTHCSLSLSVMVHVDCHYNAIRRSNGGRNADEWTKAALHNSGARCNMIVPIPVATPSASDWNVSLSRMESDLEGVVPGGGQITRYRVFLDICNLIRKFVLNRSFSESAGGGGRESNMQYLGILHLLALYLPAEGELPCTMATERLNSFLLTELTVSHWNEERLDVLRAFLRDIKIGEMRDAARESLLRESLLQWAFIDLYFNRVIPMDGEDRFKWLQAHFGETLKKTSDLVKYFDTTLLPVKNTAELAQLIEVDLNDALSLSTVTTPT